MHSNKFIQKHLKPLTGLVMGCLLSVGAHAGMTVSDSASSKNFVFNQASTKPPVETTVRSNDPFDVEVMFDKNTFKVEENFGFKVKGNQRFFLYVFYLDKKENKAVLVLPTGDHKGNMYEAGKTLSVPTTGSFYADTPGTEEMIVVASKKYFEWNTDGYTSLGNMLSVDMKQFEQQLKALHYRADEKPNASAPVAKPEALIVKKIVLVIEPKQGGSAMPAPAANEKPVVFVSTDKMNYAIDDTVQIVVGATHAGWVSVFAVDEKEQVSLLKQIELGGPTFQRFNAVVAGPAGYQGIIAVYSDTATLPDLGGLIEDIKPTRQKGLVIVDKRPINAAVRQIKVTR